MAVPDDFRLIRDIHEAGGRRRVFGEREQKRYDDLVALGWLQRLSTDAKSAHYRITERGTAAAIRS
ncbi:TenA/THI-4 family protein [Rhodopseudomonas telluris]|uniref:TenA/THI-4 family protein n=1 Tax=Rhodopseudomonas telluris TaxID=644215 RepID=A0ABV6EZS6_9BRAD